MAGGTPEIRLGSLEQGGLAPAILAVVERGIHRRPELAAKLEAEIELCTREQFPPVRIVLGRDRALIEDGAASSPDLRITGSLADLISLLVTPQMGGLPNPMRASGRAAIGLVALRRVRVEGRLVLLRRFLTLIRI